MWTSQTSYLHVGRVGELPGPSDPRLLVLATPVTFALVGWLITNTAKGALLSGAAGGALALAAILVGGTPYGGRQG